MKIKDSKFYLLGGMFTILILISAIVPSLIISNNANASNEKIISNHRMDKSLAMGKKDLMKKNHRMDKPPVMGKKDLVMKNEAYNGIGLKIKLNSDNEIIISFVYKNGPALNSGIRTGDIILKINGESLKSKTLYEITNLIKNDNLNEIDLLIQHTLSETPIPLKVTKALINTR